MSDVHDERAATAGVRAYVGIGSNLEAPEQQVQAAFDALAALSHSTLTGRSKLYRSPPWGPIAQPAFVNAAAELTTALTAEQLLAALLRIERDAGRERRERWGPRILDLDLLLYGDAVVVAEGLQIPHPRMHERAFVLVPLADLAPRLDVPGHGRVDVLLAAADRAGIVALQ